MTTTTREVSERALRAIELVRGRITFAQEGLGRVSDALDVLEQQLQAVPEEAFGDIDEELGELLSQAGAGSVDTESYDTSFVLYTATSEGEEPSDNGFSRNGCGSTGELIRRLRKERGWSQKGLAQKAGLSPPTVSNIETGKSTGVNIDTAECIARVLGQPVRELFFSIRVSELGRPAGATTSSSRPRGRVYTKCSDCGHEQEPNVRSCENCGKRF